MATLELIENEYMANAAEQGKALIAGLTEIAAKRKLIGNPRGLGLMCGVDVLGANGGFDAKLRDRIVVSAYEHGLIMLGCGEHTLRFCPPLCMTREELDAGLKIFDAAVAAVL
jgi:4-aminobutyrate aminotransferase